MAARPPRPTRRWCLPAGDQCSIGPLKPGRTSSSAIFNRATENRSHYRQVKRRGGHHHAGDGDQTVFARCSKAAPRVASSLPQAKGRPDARLGSAEAACTVFRRRLVDSLRPTETCPDGDGGYRSGSAQTRRPPSIAVPCWPGTPNLMGRPGRGGSPQRPISAGDDARHAAVYASRSVVAGEQRCREDPRLVLFL